MTQGGSYHGGLVFQGNEDGALDRFCRIVSATLEDYGHPVDRQSIIDDREARIVTSQYHARITVDTQSPSQERVVALDQAAGLNRHRRPKPPTGKSRAVITLTAVAEELDNRDVSELLLVVMLYRMVDIYSAEAIEWLEPDVQLTIEQFLGAFSNVTPRKVRGCKQILYANGERFAPIEETEPELDTRYERIMGSAPYGGQTGLVMLSDEEALALAFRSEPHPAEIDASTVQPTERDLLRLSSWGMTGCLAFLSAPVAIAMAVVNLIRGEDFRLNTQVLSYTSAIVVLHSTGAVAGVMQAIPL